MWAWPVTWTWQRTLLQQVYKHHDLHLARIHSILCSRTAGFNLASCHVGEVLGLAFSQHPAKKWGSRPNNWCRIEGCQQSFVLRINSWQSSPENTALTEILMAACEKLQIQGPGKPFPDPQPRDDVNTTWVLFPTPWRFCANFPHSSR